MSIQNIAKVAYQANKAYCETLGDTTHKDWRELRVVDELAYVERVKFIVDHPEASLEDLHNLWLASKLAEGWVYSPIKDIVKKTHPCVLSFTDLSSTGQTGHMLFKTIVFALKPLLLI